MEALRQQLLELREEVGSLRKELRNQQERWAGFNAPAESALAPALGNHHPAHEAPASQVDIPEAGHHSQGGAFNPDISAAIDFITSWSGQANQWNFTLRNVEITLQGEVDHFARGVIVLNGETELSARENLDPLEHANVVIEEAVIETTSLPWGLQLRAGQFFADFTRLGKLHGHDLPFVDRPLALEQGIGGEARARGFELSWLPPVPHETRLTVGLVDNIGSETPTTGVLAGHDDEEHGGEGGHHHGGPALYEGGGSRSFRTLTAYARAATLFELGGNAVLRVGGDYAQTSANKHRAPTRRIASGDAVVQWRPDPARPDQLEVGAEALWTEQSGYISSHLREEAENGERFASAPVRTSLAGGYGYAQYRIGRKWTPGFRVDYTSARRFGMADEELQKVTQETWAWSGYLTLQLSEFNRLRLQLSYVDSNQPLGPSGLTRNDFQAFLQWTVFLGGHKHESTHDGH